MLNIPIIVFIFCLSAIAAIGLLIGSWVRGLGWDDEEIRLHDQVMLYKSRLEEAEKSLKDKATSYDLNSIVQDIQLEHQEAGLRGAWSDDYREGVRQGLKDAILIVRCRL